MLWQLEEMGLGKVSTGKAMVVLPSRQMGSHGPTKGLEPKGEFMGISLFLLYKSSEGKGREVMGE